MLDIDVSTHCLASRCVLDNVYVLMYDKCSAVLLLAKPLLLALPGLVSGYEVDNFLQLRALWVVAAVLQ